MLSKESMTFVLATICVVVVVVAISITYFLIYELTLSATLYVVGIMMSFYFAGAALKFADDAYDENRFSKKSATVVVAGTFVIMLILSSIDSWVATISLAIVAGVTLAKKVDNVLFTFFALMFVIIIVLFGKFDQIIWHFFAAISITVLADEIGAEIGKKYWKRSELILLNSSKTKNMKNFIFYFLRYRYITPFVLLVIGVIGWFPLLYWFAWMSFDIGYRIMESVSMKLSFQKMMRHIL